MTPPTRTRKRPRTLVITNDFPPRRGGIETFVHAMTGRFPADSVVVYTSAEPGAAGHDATLPYPVVRDPARTLLPTRGPPHARWRSPVTTAATVCGSGPRHRSD